MCRMTQMVQKEWVHLWKDMKRREGRREKEKGLRNALPSYITSARVPQAGVCAICASVCVCVYVCISECKHVQEGDKM